MSLELTFEYVFIVVLNYCDMLSSFTVHNTVLSLLNILLVIHGGSHSILSREPRITMTIV